MLIAIQKAKNKSKTLGWQCISHGLKMSLSTVFYLFAIFNVVTE